MTVSDIDPENTVESVLAQNGEYAATTAGVSMFPLLRDRKYAVTVRSCSGRLQKYDVALFRRGSQLVLHRVVRVEGDRYYIRGDNCVGGEYVSDEQILGILTEINGKNKRIRTTDCSYRIYSRLIVFFHPLRTLRGKVGNLYRKIKKKRS